MLSSIFNYWFIGQVPPGKYLKDDSKLNPVIASPEQKRTVGGDCETDASCPRSVHELTEIVLLCVHHKDEMFIHHNTHKLSVIVQQESYRSVSISTYMTVKLLIIFSWLIVKRLIVK